MTLDPTLPVFLHAFWRTGSTWLWQRFRNLPDTQCFYEPYHGKLAELTASDIPKLDPGSWNSGHEAAAPYFLEYGDLIKPAGGIRGYDVRLAVDFFFPNGALEDIDLHYLNSLIGLARKRNSKPVLGFCRSLGRVGAMRQAIQGHHIVLLREPFGVVNSTIRQSMMGDYLEVAFQRRNSSLLADLGIELPPADEAMAVPVHSWGFYRPVTAGRIVLHLYLLGCFSGLLFADEVIDIDLFSDDPVYRRRIEVAIGELTKLKPDFSSSDIATNLSAIEPYVFQETGITRYLEERFFSRADDLAKSLCRLQGARAINDPEKEMSRLRTLFERSLARTKDTRRKPKILNSPTEALDHFEVEFSRISGEVLRLREVAEAQRVELDRMHTSLSWRLTAPLRRIAQLRDRWR